MPGSEQTENQFEADSLHDQIAQANKSQADQRVELELKPLRKFEAQGAAMAKALRDFADEIEAAKGPLRDQPNHPKVEMCDYLIGLARKRADQLEK